MGLWERVSKALSRPDGVGAPKAAFFKNERNLFFQSWNPALRETSQDVQAGWSKAAARAIDSIHNSGFIAGAVEVASGSTVGPGLRFSARPDATGLGWTEEEVDEWASKVEAAFKAWAMSPTACDAAGQMTFKQIQQAAFASYLAYGEAVALLPMIRRPGSPMATKVSLLPPSRLTDHTDEFTGWVQGVKTDGWGRPLAYRFRERDRLLGWKEVTIQATDRDGRPNVLHVKDPGIAVTRGISPFAPILKVTRQVDQFADATLTSALIQTIFAATLKSNINGLAAFDGLMTDADRGALDVKAFAEARGEYYDGAKIDLMQHGRIAHLFPNDELVFNEAKHPGQEYDQFMAWLLREIARGVGITYESLTGDYRGATYSSVRMAGAVEWLTVMRRRDNIVVPFCQGVYETWLEEAIGRGLLPFKGGLDTFLKVKPMAAKASWNGPVRPQADEFKTARAYEVRKGMYATTLAEIAEEYGRDWDDDMRQRARENALAEKLGQPLPWAIQSPLETKEGQELALGDAGNDGQEPVDSKPKPKPRNPRRRGGGRNPPEREPSEPNSAAALEAELEAGLTDGD